MDHFNICIQLHFITQCISFVSLQLAFSDSMDSCPASERSWEKWCGSGAGFCFTLWQHNCQLKACSAESAWLITVEGPEKKHSWGCHSQTGMEALRVENSSFGWGYLTWEILGENHPVFPLHLYKVKLYLDQLWLNFLLRIFFSKLFFTFFVKAECTLLLNMLTRDASICYGNHVSSLRYF